MVRMSKQDGRKYEEKGGNAIRTRKQWAALCGDYEVENTPCDHFKINKTVLRFLGDVRFLAPVSISWLIDRVKRMATEEPWNFEDRLRQIRRHLRPYE
ncbi:hypothetical protein PoB_001096400 [Plakobranchus ocellatus]|uniref:Uncharacterized protein n=1 Tax=Plakobranchus ocellatus TaxID=259542 RepID=A0AAV3YR42_9GAST|nr:hypothetical protein PoB_001096400 [Plakobranchus ocellatus]